MLSKTPFFPRVCPKHENLLFVVSFVNGASSAQVCHGTAHNMYYILICTSGILICRILANEACDLQYLCHVAAKGTSSDTILHPPLQNTSNPVRQVCRQAAIPRKCQFCRRVLFLYPPPLFGRNLLIRPLRTETFQ